MEPWGADDCRLADLTVLLLQLIHFVELALESNSNA